MSIDFKTRLSGKLDKSTIQINYHRSLKNSFDGRKHQNPKTGRNETFGPPLGSRFGEFYRAT